MTKEDYVSLEVAKNMQEKGFNDPCDMLYNEKEESCEYSCYTASKQGFKNSDLCNYEVSVPTLYEAQKWLIKQKNIYITVLPHYSRKYDVIEYEYIISTYFDLLEKQGNRVKSKEYYESFEQCLNNAILEALDSI